jgi:hypothetical protein
MILALGILITACLLDGCSRQQRPSFSSGYDREELTELLCVCERIYDSSDLGGFKTPDPTEFTHVYRSPVSPLINRFDIWKSEDGRGVFAFRGTILDTAGLSFSLNFYALMVAAEGQVKVSDSFVFQYKLASLPGATVHLGCLLGLATLSNSLLDQVQRQYADGIKDFYIIGHSQGAGLAYYATAWLRYLQKKGKLPEEIRFKTYAIAAPKAGNMLFAYDYENITSGGWSFSVQNVIDWVPYIPLSFERTEDFPVVGPFTHIRSFLKDATFPPGPDFERGYAFYSKTVPVYLDTITSLIHRFVHPRIARALPGYEEPATIPSSYFERIGITVPLVPDPAYYRKFPNDPEQFSVWENHSVYPYYVLVKGE